MKEPTSLTQYQITAYSALSERKTSNSQHAQITNTEGVCMYLPIYTHTHTQYILSLHVMYFRTQM